MPYRVYQTGQLGDFGTGAEAAVLFRRSGTGLFQGAEGCADLGGDGVCDGERGLDPALAQPSQRGRENPGTARALARMRIGVPLRWMAGAWSMTVM
ncbi:hypothetical protein ACIREE_39230 [Streptomyces sp. NPDC102467]|uniref:hypothetical protein n=1 Tax=Streptomyces sp. NPDC102467 TaxID=3366179 RepID=UPI0038019311